MSSTWSGSLESGHFENEGGLYIDLIDNDWKLGSNEIDDEGIDFLISLKDLFNNPIFRILSVDPVTGKIPLDVLPSIFFGNTYRVPNFQSMLALTQAIVGDVAVIAESGGSFRLATPDYSVPGSWTELVSKHTQWRDIQNRPKFEPEYDLNEEPVLVSNKHTHEELYPTLKNGKIPTKYIEAFPIGNRFRVNTIDEILELSAVKGDIAFVKESENRGRYQLFGLASNINDWIKLEDPDASVVSVNGQSGNVYLDSDDVGALSFNTTPEDIGASANNHEHVEIKSVDNYNTIGLYFDGSNLYYTVNGGATRPFA